ncbi:hypothetical protein [Flavonifractor hominis]|uniref:DUF5666 domain-containing protein n=1 Tax=Flavonifractor hominis TaxID=3133178 RepID=A0ABV1EQY5_9FIRM
MNRHAPKALLLAGFLMLALAACKPNVPVPASSPSAPVESPEETVRTFEGVLNLVDTGLDYLVLVDDDGNFYRFNLNGVSTDDLVPGDHVKASYTGTLSAEDGSITATLTALEKIA